MKNIFTILVFSLFTTCGFAQKSWAQGNTELKIVKFYPNPATTYITFDIQRSLERGAVIQIINCLGRRVITAAVTGTKFTVQLDNLFRGLYNFQLIDKNGKIIESNKFVVNK